MSNGIRASKLRVWLSSNFRGTIFLLHLLIIEVYNTLVQGAQFQPKVRSDCAAFYLQSLIHVGIKENL